MNKIIIWILCMIMLVVPVFATNIIMGESSSITDIEYYQINESVKIQYPCYSEGRPCHNATCNILIINPYKELIINEIMNEEYNIFSYIDTYNETGIYNYEVQCNQNDSYGSVSGVFEIGENSIKGLSFWTCPDTSSGFNILYILIGLSIFTIILALWINESLIGVMGGLMILFSYFYIGGCAPLLASPLLVVGLLITAFFGLAK